jgi:hypothetical protein
MSTIHPAMTREELGALVCETLHQHGIHVVLSGGAVVSIYSDSEYESYDLDFIRTDLVPRLDPAMEALGFRKSGARQWQHPDTHLWVDFTSGPVMVGHLAVTKFAERRTRFGVLRLLAPTECVMDRLANYYHFDDPQALDQALAVATRQPVDIGRIKVWSRDEAAEDKFSDFVGRLKVL